MRPHYFRTKKSKYNATKVVVDGDVYDSKKEARRGVELTLAEKVGKIENLRRQVKYILIPEQREPDTVGPRGGKKKGKLIEKEIAYIADFVYEQDGQTIVEDVKGYKGGQSYAVFSMKRKMMLYFKGIRVKEV